jgi:PAS domain S-box-containing protein
MEEEGRTLYEQEPLSHAILNSLSAHIAVLNGQGDIIHINDAWKRFAAANGGGSDPRLGVGMNYLDVCRSASQSLDLEAHIALTGIEEVLTGVLKEFEIEYPCHGPNEQRWFQMRVTPLAGFDGGAVISHTEITRQRRSEETLRLEKGLAQQYLTERSQFEEERAKLAAAIEQAAEAVFITDRRGNIEYVNAAFEKLSEKSRDELIGKNILALDKECAPFCQAVKEAMSRREVLRNRVSRKMRDGSRCDFETTISPIRNDSEAISGFVSLSRDITQEVDLERQLRQTQKLEAIGTLAGGIAHDFNNILASVLGFSEMTLFSLPHGTKEHYNLVQVVRAAKRAKDLVKQILLFSRRRPTEEKKPLEIVLLVKEALKFLRASLPSTVEIRQGITVSPGSLILADHTQIHQVLMNLCTNAAHAMSEKGGVLQVEVADVMITDAELVDYRELKPGRYVRLGVSDTGHGMDEAMVERIFDPFFTTKSSGEGTGLGLAVVHGIVSSHGGTIRVRSEEGKGSTFDVYFPMIGSMDEVRRVRPSPIPRGKGCVLFVDDEPDLVYSARRILESLGYEVVTCNGGREALEVFRSRPDRFDLVITDYTMPHMTGIELARELIRSRPSIPIVLSSGFSQSISPEEIERAGICEFVMKPLTVRDMAEMIARVLEKTTAKSSNPEFHEQP